MRNQAGLQFVTLRNMSGSGVCFDAFSGAAEGDEVEFCIDSTGVKRGVVRWVKDGRCGIVTHGGNQDELAPHYLAQRSVRLPLSVAVKLYVDGRGEDAMLRNISIRGACISSRSELAPGQLVSLAICGSLFELATVRWVKQGLFGLRFANPTHPSRFRELVAKVQQVPDAVLTCPPDFTPRVKSVWPEEGQTIKRARFSEEQMGLVEEAEAGAKTADLATRHGAWSDDLQLEG